MSRIEFNGFDSTWTDYIMDTTKNHHANVQQFWAADGPKINGLFIL